MRHDYDFLIVGGGMVADAAAKGIRAQGAEGTIGIVGEEPTPPFPRPALSKKLWIDPEFTVDDGDLDTAGQTGATLHLGVQVTAIDPGAKQVTSDSGDVFGYGRLLLATGGRPRRIEGLAPSERVLYFRTLTDYQRLRHLAGGDIEIAVVGGGYVGTEIASVLSELDCRVTLVFPQDVLNETLFPEPLAREFHDLFVEAGVRLVGGVEVVSGRQDGDAVSLRLSNGGTLDVDVVVVGLGIDPAGELGAHLLARSDDGGIVVDERLATSVADVYAAGDVAEYPDRILGRRRVEHVDNADAMGGAVGRIMAGSDETYDHTPMFYSDVLDHGFEAVGTLDATLEMVLDHVDDDGTVVYYLDAEQVVGVLLWDGEGGIDAARELLARHSRPANGVDLVGVLRHGALVGIGSTT